LKYNFPDARYVLERASARETTARVAVGALAKAFLGQFGIRVLSHVIGVGEARLGRPAAWEELVDLSKKEAVLLACVDAEAEARMKEVVDHAYRTGDTVGGVFEVIAHGVPPGLGSHVTWDSRLDGRLAQAIVSMQAVKGVEIGFAAEGASSFGSRVQDTIHYNREERQFTRGANRAGGLEGGMTNGQDLLVRGMLKPISTLRRPLESVDLVTREPMVSIVLAQAFLEKFGGDSLMETRRNFEGYKEQLRNF
jgi:chorismate synthase